MKKKLLIIVSHLGIGGAQRFITNFANDLVEDYTVQIIGLHINNGPNFITELHSKINYKVIGKRAALSVRDLSQEIKSYQPEIIFTTQSYINNIVIISKILSSVKSRVIIREASIISNKKDLSYWSAKLLYKYADKVIAQTGSIKDDIITVFGCSPRKVVVIPNYINIELINSKANEYIIESETVAALCFLFCGRLDKVKNVDFLIKTLAECRVNNQEFEFWIVGDGSEKKKLQNYCQENNLNFVRFFGFKQNPYPYMKGADCLLLASYREGFPNVMVEAMALNNIVFTNNFLGGAAHDILDDDLSTYIYKDEEELKTLIFNLFKATSSEKTKLKDRFVMRSRAYHKDIIFDKYLE